MKGARPILSREKSQRDDDKSMNKDKEENGSPILSRSANGSVASGERISPRTPPQGQSEFQPIDLTWDTADRSSPTLPSQDSIRESADGSGEFHQASQGPYQLLVKERLMGIYLAIFVHRDAAQFVEGESANLDLQMSAEAFRNAGISKDAVATGLLRGRIGNKGGVGISIKIAGVTLLFVNAHLAGKCYNCTLTIH